MSAHVSPREFSSGRTDRRVYLVPSHTDTSLHIKESTFQNFTKSFRHTSLNSRRSFTKSTGNYVYCCLLHPHIETRGSRVGLGKGSETKHTAFSF